MRGMLGEVHRAQRLGAKGGRQRDAYSFVIDVAYKSKTGERKKITLKAAGFPEPGAIKQRRKKGESEPEAFKRIAGQTINAAVIRSINNAEGVERYTSREETAIAKGSRKQIAAALRSFKKRRQASFKVRVSREVTT